MVKPALVVGRHGAAAHQHTEHIEWRCPDRPGMKRLYFWSLFCILVSLTCAFPAVSHGAQSGEVLVPSLA
jgi:hypothetical protein